VNIIKKIAATFVLPNFHSLCLVYVVRFYLAFERVLLWCGRIPGY